MLLAVFKYMRQKHLHKNFRLTDAELTHFFASPLRFAVFIAVFVTIILCVAVLIQVELLNNKKVTNLEIIKQLTISQTDIELQYKQSVKGILNEYLQQRTQESFFNSATCIQFINSTVNKILGLTVSPSYKDFHLKLIVIFDQENKNCGTSEKINKELEKSWSDLLNKYNWLKN